MRNNELLRKYKKYSAGIILQMSSNEEFISGTVAWTFFRPTWKKVNKIN